MDSIGECNHIPATNLYRETNKNTSFPYANSTSGDSSVPSGSGGKGATSSQSTAMTNMGGIPLSISVAAAFAALGSLLL